MGKGLGDSKGRVVPFCRLEDGKIYFILLALANGKSIRISGPNPSLPIVYLTLKNRINTNAGNYPLFSWECNNKS